MSNLNVKVATSTLIERAEQMRADIIKAHVAAKAKYEKELPAHKAKAAKALEAAAKRAAKGDLTEVVVSDCYRSGRYQTTLEVMAPGCKHPDKPGKEPETSNIDRDLKFLRATSEATITVRVNSNWERYL